VCVMCFWCVCVLCIFAFVCVRVSVCVGLLCICLCVFVCVSVRPPGTTQIPLDLFILNLSFDCFENVCR